MRGISCTLILLCLLCGCEGFRTLAVYNQTGDPVMITTARLVPKPSGELSDSNDVLSERQFVVLRDNLHYLHQAFGPAGRFGRNDLDFDYLRIVTTTDTIEARGDDEIMDLIRSGEKRFRKFPWKSNEKRPGRAGILFQR